MNIILGIDSSTKYVGFALLEGTKLITWTLDLTHIKDNRDKILCILESLEGRVWANQYPVGELRVVCESTFQAVNAKTGISLARVCGWIEALCALQHLEVEFVPTLSAKSTTTGHTKAPKCMTRAQQKDWWRRQIQREAQNRWGMDINLETEHCADACALCIYAVRHPNGR